MVQWHAVLPFYFGVNRYVTGGGGAPVSRKIAFLTRTVASLRQNIDKVEIVVTVCDDASEAAAGTVIDTVQRLDCLPLHLPYATVQYAAHHLCRSWPADDIVLFNEDDQVMYLDPRVREDIEQHGHTYIFSPHRWVCGGKGRRFRSAPHYTVDNQSGVIDNVYAGEEGTRYSFNHIYRSQHSRLSAYAACWATCSASLQYIDFSQYETDPQTICLETASFLMLDTPLPVIKLELASEPAVNFLVNHLSGQHSFSRRFSIKRLMTHIHRMKF